MKAETRELEALYVQLAQLSRTRVGASPGAAARVRAAQRWLSDQYALWLFCDHAACRRACRCRGRGVACYRSTMDRVPADAVAGLRICLAAQAAGGDPLMLLGEHRRAVDALVAWRRRLGLPPLPASAPVSAGPRESNLRPRGAARALSAARPPPPCP